MLLYKSLTFEQFPRSDFIGGWYKRSLWHKLGPLMRRRYRFRGKGGGYWQNKFHSCLTLLHGQESVASFAITKPPLLLHIWSHPLMPGHRVKLSMWQHEHCIYRHPTNEKHIVLKGELQGKAQGPAINVQVKKLFTWPRDLFLEILVLF